MPPRTPAVLAVLLLAASAAAASKPPIVFLPGLMASALTGTYSRPSSRASAAAAAAPSADGGDALDRAQVRRVTSSLGDFARKQANSEATAAGLFKQSGVCPAAGNLLPLQLWAPADPRFLTWPSCWYHMMRINYNATTRRFSDNPGVTVRPRDGGESGSKYPIFDVAGYNKLFKYLSQQHGYTAGKDLFAAPYDWRLDLTGLDSSGVLDGLAERISKAVAANGGQRAVLVGHSMGSLVALELLQNPRFAAWRQANVAGYIALAPPLGGSLNTISARTSGVPTNAWVEKLLGSAVQDVTYTVGQGMPSPVMLFPYSTMLPADWVVLSTPERNFTVAQQPQLLAALGDQQAVDMYDQVHSLDARLTPTAVPTFCIYGSNINTSKSWRFSENIRAGKRAPKPAVAVMGKGDGTVNLESLRLCSRITAPDRITELSASVDHGSVVTASVAQAAISQALMAIMAGGK